MQALRSVGITDNQIRVVTVPGAFEIPLACKAAAARMIVMRSLHWALSSGVVHRISNMWRGSARAALARWPSMRASRWLLVC